MLKIIMGAWLLIIVVFFINPQMVLAKTCNSGDTSCTGTCTTKPFSPDPNKPPTSFILDKDNCSKPDFVPNFSTIMPVRASTNNVCNCVPLSDGTPLVCKPPTSCANDSECSSSATNCVGYVCSGVIPGRTPGRCVDSSTLCIKSTQTCNTDSDCTSGGPGCSQYSCWTIGTKGKQCNLGPTPAPNTPTPGTPLGGAGQHCPTSPTNPQIINTALGCIDVNPATFVQTLLKWVLGFAGGVALLLMILGAFQMVTSAGSPDALKAGQEQFSAALIGLVFVLLSVTLLQIIGVDILNLPGLTR